MRDCLHVALLLVCAVCLISCACRDAMEGASARELQIEAGVGVPGICEIGMPVSDMVSRFNARERFLRSDRDTGIKTYLVGSLPIKVSTDELQNIRKIRFFFEEGKPESTSSTAKGFVLRRDQRRSVANLDRDGVIRLFGVPSESYSRKELSSTDYSDSYSRGVSHLITYSDTLLYLVYPSDGVLFKLSHNRVVEIVISYPVGSQNSSGTKNDDSGKAPAGGTGEAGSEQE